MSRALKQKLTLMMVSEYELMCFPFPDHHYSSFYLPVTIKLRLSGNDKAFLHFCIFTFNSEICYFPSHSSFGDLYLFLDPSSSVQQQSTHNSRTLGYLPFGKEHE